MLLFLLLLQIIASKSRMANNKKCYIKFTDDTTDPKDVWYVSQGKNPISTWIKPEGADIREPIYHAYYSAHHKKWWYKSLCDEVTWEPPNEWAAIREHGYKEPDANESNSTEPNTAEPKTNEDSPPESNPAEPNTAEPEKNKPNNKKPVDTGSIFNFLRKRFTRANGKITFYKGTAEEKLQSIIENADKRYPNVRKDILTKLIKITELSLDRYRKGGLKAGLKWGKGILGRILAVPANVPFIGWLLLPLPSALITSSQENFLKANIRSTIKNKILDEIEQLLEELNRTTYPKQEQIMIKRTEDHIKLFIEQYSDAKFDLHWEQWMPDWPEISAVWSTGFNTRDNIAHRNLLKLQRKKGPTGGARTRRRSRNSKGTRRQ